MDKEICFICEDALNKYKTSTVQQKAVASLISASIWREDNKYIKFQLRDKECISVHGKCYKCYSDIREIYREKNIRKMEPPTTSMRSTRRDFDFENNCLFCGNDAGQKFLNNQAKEKNKSKRQTVSIVKGDNVRKRILEQSSDRSDKWRNEVVNRIASTFDLVSLNARYHSFCHLRFFSRSHLTDQSVSDTPQVTEMIKKFVNDHPHEHHFSLKTIVDSYEGKVANNECIKKKLYEKFGDEIIITSNTGAKPVIYLRDASQKMLLKNFQDSNTKETERLKIVTAAAMIITEDIHAAKYNMNNYPSPNSFLENDEEVIPNSLRVFLNNITLTDKQKKGKGKFLSKIVDDLLKLTYEDSDEIHSVETERKKMSTETKTEDAPAVKKLKLE